MNKFLSIFCALALAVPAVAQDPVNETVMLVEEQPQKKSFINGFFVSVGAGAQLLFADHDVRDSF